MNQNPDIQNIVMQVLSKLQGEPSGSKIVFDEDEVEHRVLAAAAAQEVWHRDYGVERRCQIIAQIRADLRPHAEELAQMALTETGMGNLGIK